MINIDWIINNTILHKSTLYLESKEILSIPDLDRKSIIPRECTLEYNSNNGSRAFENLNNVYYNNDEIFSIRVWSTNQLGQLPLFDSYSQWDEKQQLYWQEQWTMHIELSRLKAISSLIEQHVFMDNLHDDNIDSLDTYYIEVTRIKKRGKSNERVSYC